MKINVGAAYYPEEWNREQIIRDAELMQQAGVAYARIGEFAWSHMEPREGDYQFQWLRDAVNILGEHGVKTILCTPSSAAPAWMCKKYPEILRFYPHSNHRAWFGVRDHTCYTSGVYRHFIRRIVHRMAEEFKGNPYVGGWQIDNEPGGSRFTDCACPDCQRAFRSFLKKKYGTLENLNRCWGNTFWSGEHCSWDDIDLEARWENMGSCCVLDSILFRSDELVSFITEQADEIRKISPDALIGTNTITLADRYKGYEKLDFAGNDIYPRGGATPEFLLFRSDLYNGLKPDVPAWMLETQPGPSWPRRDLMRLYFWTFISHGYDHIFYFHWHQHLAGNEKVRNFIVGPAGNPSMRYHTLKNNIAESVKVLGELPQLPKPRHDCAVIFDYPQFWIYALGYPDRFSLYEDYGEQHYNAFRRYNDAPEVVSSETDFSRYKVVDLQIYPHISRAMAAKFRKYVENGGVLIMNGCSGMMDGNSKNLPQDGPEHVQDLFGITIGENHGCPSPDKIPVSGPDPSPDSEFTVVAGELNGKKVSGAIGVWTSCLKAAPETKVLMRFANSALKGYPFLTMKQYGKGYALYFNADAVNVELMDEIMAYAQSLAGIPCTRVPKDVDVSHRGNVTFFTNFSDREVSFPTDVKGKNILGNGLKDGIMTIPPMDTVIVRKE